MGEVRKWEKDREIEEWESGKRESSVGSGGDEGLMRFWENNNNKRKENKVKKKRRMRGKRWDKRGEGKEVVG